MNFKKSLWTFVCLPVDGWFRIGVDDNLNLNGLVFLQRLEWFGNLNKDRESCLVVEMDMDMVKKN